MIESGALGKKVFFLYPPPVLTEIVDGLAHREFDVYLVKDHARLMRVLAAESDAIVFANLDDGLEESAWEGWIRNLKATAATVGIGIITLNDDLSLREKYLMDIQVPCGFVTLKIGTAKAMEILVKTLEANEARGRRKFVRAACPAGSSSLIVDAEGGQVRGELTDISSAGMAVRFEGGAAFKTGSVLRSVQVTLKGVRLNVNAIVVAHREGDKDAAHVLMFEPSSIDEVKKEKLHGLVLKLNQAHMDQVIAAS